MSDEQAEQLELFPVTEPRPRPRQRVTQYDALKPDINKALGAPMPIMREGKLRLGILVSGRASSLETILQLCAENVIPATVVVVISNHRDAQAFQIAQAHGISTYTVPRAGHTTRLAQQIEMSRLLDVARAELIVLDGFDRIVEPEICERYEGRIIHAHPSLLPAFAGGLHAIAEALAHGVRYTGVTIHFVTEGIDDGPIILQEPVPVEPEDSAQSLLVRVQEVEQRLLPEAIRLFAQDRLRIEGRRVFIE